MQLVEVQVERQAQPALLRHDVDEVRLGLVGDVELEELLGDARVERQHLLAEGLEERPHRAVLGEVRVVVDGVAGRPLALRPVGRPSTSAGSAGAAQTCRGLLGEPLGALPGWRPRSRSRARRGPRSAAAGSP